MVPVIIGFYGKSNSGKTSLIIYLVQQMIAKGYKVATIKKTDKSINFDSAGKDTWKHSQAGVSIVVLSSSVETDFIMKEKQPIGTIVKQIMDFVSVDVVLVEGADEPDILKIRLGDIQKRENTIADFNNNIEEIVELIERKINERDISVEKDDVKIFVNGKQIPLSVFPASMIKNTVVGMITSLKGIDEIHEVDLHIKN